MTTGPQTLQSRPVPTPDLPDPPKAFRYNERFLIAQFCLVAIVRIFVFTAAFPFFNNIDEQFHLDLICLASHGQFPTKPLPVSEESAKLISRYETAEYLHSPRDMPGGELPGPIWTWTPQVQEQLLQQAMTNWMNMASFQAGAPPVYYALAGAWYRFGKLVGIEGGNLLYWTRFLNIPIFVLLIWLSYAFAKELFPNSQFVYLGVPLLIAFLPQDIFYSLNNDVLSAPMTAISLYLFLKLYRSDVSRPGLAIAAGLATAGTFLTKLGNSPIVVIAGIVAVVMLIRAIHRKQSIGHFIPPVLLLAGTIIPIGLWMLRNYLTVGDLTAAAEKARFLTWTPKPLSQYLDHPIFTPGGFAYFWRELISSFWRGEFCWYRDTMAFKPVDILYVVTSTLFGLCFVIAAIKGARNRTIDPFDTTLCLAPIILSIGLMIYLSISYDFGTCFYPSRALPYFISGRLILCMLVPFLVIFLHGLESLMQWIRLDRARWPILIGFIVIMTISEIILSAKAFNSAFNWFHLPGS